MYRKEVLKVLLYFFVSNGVPLTAGRWIRLFHPRLYKLGDYRYLKKIDNLKLYGPELDRTRLVKWADIVVCSDHCTMLFEGMILQKKVVSGRDLIMFVILNVCYSLI